MTRHDGHRQRMRDRFRAEGLEAFAPHEALELLLFYARARGDVNPLAHELMDTFGSLRGVLEASPEQLMKVKGVGEETATLLSMIVPLFRRYSESVLEDRQRLTNRSDAMQYCKALSAGLRTERLYAVYLSANGTVLGRRIISEGTLTEVPTYPRLIVESAMNHNAHSVMLCHNHPGGSSMPSSADVEATRYIQKVLRSMEIVLQDHIVVADGEAYSMAAKGLLTARHYGINCQQEVLESAAQPDLLWADERMQEP